ncbi:MAG: hypothetical protein WC144_03120 [Sulfurimonas sp.]|jgi:hypothetical protein|nr:hypothetical protein [Sulfurimonadaceae bacterium]
MVSVRLDEKLEKELLLVAKKNSLPKSRVIKDALIYYFNMLKKQQTKQTPYELGCELFGKYSSGNSNLSTTYKQKLKEKLHAKSTSR